MLIILDRYEKRLLGQKKHTKGVYFKFTLRFLNGEFLTPVVTGCYNSVEVLSH